MSVEIGCMFENKKKMLKHLKKKSYEANFTQFQSAYGTQLAEIMAYVEHAADKESAVAEVGDWFVNAVLDNYASGKKKLPSYEQADVNLFMIYYVFPALLETGHADARQTADGICAVWAKRFRGNKIGYTDYQTLYESFHDKILGIF